MALRAVKPESIQKRLKCLFYGVAGVGKTTAAISFPKVYLIDTEKGAENEQYATLLSSGGGAVFQTCDFDELMAEVKSLLSETHEYRTLVIDPLTTVYDDLLDKVAKKVGTEFGRHYAEANKQMKHLCSLLTRLDMNVIITSHAKTEYGSNMSVIGQTFDGYKKLDYLFDLVLEIQKRGKDHVGVVKKSRIKNLAEAESFPFSYNEIAERYGREVLERDTVAQELALPEQISEIMSLISSLKISPDIYNKWLAKSNAETFDEMPKDVIVKCINYLKTQAAKINSGD